MLSLRSKGDWNNTIDFLRRARLQNLEKILHYYGQKGVDALKAVTPVATGLTQSSWGYEITTSPTSTSIIWTNDNIVDGTAVVLLLQYGHGTRTGGYVHGRDFINPAIQPIMDEIEQAVWREVVGR